MPEIIFWALWVLLSVPAISPILKHFGASAKQANAASLLPIAITGAIVIWGLRIFYLYISNSAKEHKFEKKAMLSLPEGFQAQFIGRTYIGRLVISYKRQEAETLEIRYELFQEDGTSRGVAEISLPLKEWQFSAGFSKDEILWIKGYEAQMEVELNLYEGIEYAFI